MKKRKSCKNTDFENECATEQISWCTVFNREKTKHRDKSVHQITIGKTNIRVYLVDVSINQSLERV